MHSSPLGSTLFDDASAHPLETLSKKGFAEAIGVSPGRVSQLIASGLPVEPNGRIHVARGKAWVAENVDPNRRRASLDTLPLAPALLSPRAVRDTAEAEIARMKAERMGRALIDRAATLRTIETRARVERDAWIGWVNRAAPEIAAAAGADLAVVVGALDRLVRAQLASLANLPIGDIAHD
ncbi:hypothetical protein [Ancylobacter amanitiformis]|uniref:Uncharacterized protein n=1 Tax=Ancylobacter amanitiformis TaxID=217069 RepID=A0ABU0LVT6_9HYPH|nr:hypothetical protein [Ancylobacter amanitiformis]MDQ0512715.1 hypothetical protein [Ancylobacter amanitiformis]